MIHNAPFDMKFLNWEWKRMGLPELPMSQATDTLEMARAKFPGAQNTLDGLCRRYGIDNSNRTLHGALLDSEILAEVYLEMIGGRQPGLVLNVMSGNGGGGVSDDDWRPRPRPEALPSRITDEEAAAHAEFVDGLGDGALWKNSAKSVA